MTIKKNQAPPTKQRLKLQAQFETLMQQVQTTRTHFRNVVEKNVDGIVIVNTDSEIMYLNPAAERLFGEERRGCVGEKWMYDLSLTGTVETVIERSEPPHCVVEMRTVQTEWEGAAALLVSIRDITERRLAEEEIHRLNAELEAKVMQRTEQLEALNHELEAFNYAVSHDLRTPLARIDGYASLLLSEMADRLLPDNKHFLQRIRASVAQMVALTDGLLQLSRLNTRPLERSEFNLSALALGILEVYRQESPQRKVSLHVHPEMHVNADYVLVRAALENLLSNAWKFTGETAVTDIAVGCEVHRDEQVFFVRDNGIGFDAQDSVKLFQAFQRLHGDASFPGVGIGLTTVRRIIHRHGGRVWAEATPRQGAAFYFTLPIGG